MHRKFGPLIVITLLATYPLVTFASGSGITATRSSSQQSLNNFSYKAAQPESAPASRVVVAEEPYNLGKALFSGKYKFGAPKLKAANVAEKMQRLVTLQSVVPAHEQKKIKPSELAGRLTDREMNALEYFVGVRFGKVIARPPSWAKEEPPPKFAHSR